MTNDLHHKIPKGETKITKNKKKAHKMVCHFVLRVCVADQLKSQYETTSETVTVQ